MTGDRTDRQGPGRPWEELPERLREKQDEPHVRGRRRYGTGNGTDMTGRRKAPAGPHEAFPGRPSTRPVPPHQTTRQPPPCALDEPPKRDEDERDEP